MSHVALKLLMWGWIEIVEYWLHVFWGCKKYPDGVVGRYV